MSIVRKMESWDWEKLSWFIAIDVAVVMFAASFFLGGGYDLYFYYAPFAKGCLDCGFTPYYAQWILWPLAFLPGRFAWPVWTAINLAAWLALCRWTKANPALVLLAFPMVGQLWLGQIDSIICAGLALALFSKNAYARGLGFALALIKPQFTGIVIFFLLTREREIIKTLLAPFIMLVASFIVYGIYWPLDWVTNAMNGVPNHVWRMAANDIWPIGLIFVWLPFLFSERRERFETALLISVLATPFVGIYSYPVFLVFTPATWWTVPLSYVQFLGYPIWEEYVMRVAWVLPAALLLQKLYLKYTEHGWKLRF